MTSAIQPPSRVRLGVIDYLNTAPICDALLRGGWPAILAGVPARVNGALAAGEIDLSVVSSYAFGENARRWLLVPRLSVAARASVESVLLFSWRADLGDLDGARVALTDHSATSAALLKLLLERRHGVRPRYRVEPPRLDAMLAENDAALLIGDGALVEGHARRAIAGKGRPHVFDLASEWHAWTGLPFVFAVWAVRAERAAAIREGGALEALFTSKRRGLARLDQIAEAAAARLSLPAEVCARYLGLLEYDLTEQHLLGLRRFLEMAVPGFSWDDARLLGDEHG